MGPLSWVLADLGLVVFTLACGALVLYLIHVMIHPEQV